MDLTPRKFPPDQSTTDEQSLGQLAIRFRQAPTDSQRRDIAVEYARVVNQLIQTKAWTTTPPPEDRLPDNWMPKAFSQHWEEQAHQSQP